MIRFPRVTVLAAVAIVLFWQPGTAKEAEYLSYEEFLTKVRLGQVKSAALDRFSEISGVYVEQDVSRPFVSYADTGFANDPLLVQLLKDHNVALEIREDERPDWRQELFAPLFFVMLVPVFTFLMVLFISFQLFRLRRAQRQSAENHDEDATGG